MEDPGNGTVCMLRMLVKPEDDAAPPADLTNMEGQFWQQVKHDLRRSKWVDEATYNLVVKQHPFLGLDRYEPEAVVVCLNFG